MEYLILAGAILGNLGGWLVALGLFLERRRLLEKIRGLDVLQSAYLADTQRECRANKELRAENERLSALVAKARAGAVEDLKGRGAQFVKDKLKEGR